MGIPFKGLANTLYPIFRPSYFDGMDPQESQVDPQNELGLHHLQA